MIYSFAVSFALGIAFAQIFNLGSSVGALVLIVSSVLFFYFRRENFPARKIIFVAGLAFCLGVVRINFADTSPDQKFLDLVGQKISFEATISDEPDVRDNTARYTVKQVDSKSFVLLVADRFPEFKYGDKMKISGKLDLPKKFESDNGTEFDYVSYLSKDKIHFLIYYPQIEKLKGGEGNKILTLLYSLKNNFIQKISDVVPEPNSSLLSGIIFGAKQSLGEQLLNDFRNAGLIHIAVLSGYNMTVIVAGILYTANYFGKRRIGFAASVLVLILFSAMVGFGATVIRASIMALIAILAKYLGRPNDALRALFVAGLLMLLWNPLTLLSDPSFQLSFMATLGLILFSSFVENFITRSKFQKFIPMKWGLREIFSSTLAVQFFLLPLLIKMSGTFSLVSFVVNLLVLPLIPTVMLFGFVAGFLGFVPFLGKILSWPFGAISYLLTEIMIRVAEISASLPLSVLKTGTIPLWLIFVWYAFYSFIFYRLNKRFNFSE